jgi:DNA-binding IclR family transcriptional regulator
MPKRKRDSASDLAENRRGIQSVEVGVPLLRALQNAPGALSLSALSEATGMPASKAHRYLASYARSQLVRQDRETRRYELGPFALSLGLAALSQLDLIALGGNAAREVTQTTGLTTLMAVWSTPGAVIVRWNRGTLPVITSLALGSLLSPLTSATGQVFLANLPRAVTTEAVRGEQRARQRLKLPPLSDDFIADLVANVRHQGCAWVDGGVIPGLKAFSCPILDYQGEAAAALTVVSAVEHIADPKHPAARALMDSCATVNEQAGRFEVSAPRYR